MAEDSIEAVEKVLGKPVDGGFTDNALKVRRNLLAISFVSIFIVIAGIKLDPSSSVLGFKFIGITDSMVTRGLIIATSYLLVHFLWYSFENLLEWRLRVTGTRLAFVTGSRFGSGHADYPDDPRQSTLYSWWTNNANRIGSLQTPIDELAEKVQEWEAKITQFKDGKDSLNLANAMSTLSNTSKAIADLTRKIEHTEKTLCSLRISTSLRHFDGWFELFLRSQNLRWLLIEMILPIGVGTTAVFLLATTP